MATTNVYSVSPGQTYSGDPQKDVYIGTAASFNNDTIVNLKIDDLLQITDPNLTPNNLNLSINGDKLTFANGDTVTIDNLGPGRLIVTSLGTNKGVEIRLAEPAHNDFNGDGFSDLMFRDQNGTMSEWLAHTDHSGTFSWNPNAGFQVGTDWSMLGFGDFNGDGQNDILWRQGSSGTFMVWDGKTDGTFSWAVNYNLPTSYTFAGIGDFNGDGRADIMWRDPSGTLSEWLGQANGSFAWNPNAAFNLGTDWQLAATGDFNGDGKDDLLWRNTTTGQVMEWQGQPNGSFAWSANYDLSTNFHLAGTGDFNGDGITDLIWRDANGTLSEWLGQSNGSFVWNQNAAYPMSNDWQLVGTGDYNGDTIDDLIWRSTSTGKVIEWLGHPDGTFSLNQSAQYDVATNFHSQPPSDHLL